MLWKCCTEYASKFGKLHSGHQTGKGQFSFHSQRRALPKNVQTTVQLCSFHMLTKLCSKSFKLGFSSEPRAFRWTRWLLKKQMNQRSNCQHPLGHWKGKRISEKCPLLFYFTQSLCRSQQTGKFLKKWEYKTTSPASWETACRSRRNT